jgi:ribosomal protein S18 acetylase RimI-like enzyme
LNYTEQASIVDLREVRALDLDPLLREETAEFERELDWDYSKSADLVRKAADAQILGGAALCERGEIAGYACASLAGDKALIWDLYVRPAWRAGTTGAVLFRVLIEALIGMGLRRIECQLMLGDAEFAKALQRERAVQLIERILLRLDEDVLLPSRSVDGAFRFEGWADHADGIDGIDGAAAVIAAAYAGHVDVGISDEYGTGAGARLHVKNIVEFPGSSTFYAAGSYIAIDMNTDVTVGIALGSFVGAEVGHIAQICVRPEAKGAGVGYELLRLSIAGLRQGGAKRVSLTVTAANEEAVRLYLRCGFREVRRFYAYIWDVSG